MRYLSVPPLWFYLAIAVMVGLPRGVCADGRRSDNALPESVERPVSAKDNGEAEKDLEAVFELYRTDLVTTGSFLDLTVRQSTAALTIITHEQIAASGARTITDLLEIFVPGLHYCVGKWQGLIWGMRGFSLQDLPFIFLVNGLKENLQSRNDPPIESTLGLMQDIERVEVLRGPAGLAYGANALAGVVNVVTRTPTVSTAEVRVAGGPRNVQAEAFSNMQLGEANALTLSAGFMRDLGAGLHASRVYGQSSYPSTYNLYHADGLPTEGSAMAQPGNLRVGLDWRFENLRVWARWTRHQFANSGFFTQDPWPAIPGNPSPNTAAVPGQIDGRSVPANASWVPVDSLGLGRDLYTINNFSVAAHYDVHFDEDRLDMDLAWNGVTDRTVEDLLNAFAVPTALSNRPAGQPYITFGERRYSASATYLLKRIHRLQSGSGIQFRIDDIGRDLEGFNSYNGIAKHTALMPVVYTSLALFTENQYWFGDTFAVEAGGRLDMQTRAGVQFNPKLAAVYLPNEDHVVKLMLQSSTGNNTSFNYEYNYYHYSDQGTVNTTSTLASPTGTTVIPPVTLDTLHALKPERSLSVELTSTHNLFNSLTISPSISWNRMLDLFEFSQDLFICVNAGQYDAINLEIDIADSILKCNSSLLEVDWGMKL